jgi:excisionase family DNA binding protein
MVEPMMTARQVAEVLGVHENWVYDQAVGGDLPSYKIGGARRFQPDEVIGWISEHREAQRERQARKRTARAVNATGAAQTRTARAKDLEPDPHKSRPTRSPSTETAAAGDGDPQPKLFES